MSVRRNRKEPLASWLASGLAAVLLAGFASAGWAREPEAPRHPREKTFMKRQWGVEVMHVRRSAAGYMLEFRYKVLDPVKAKPLFERRTKPVLTHLESGAKLIVPTPAKTGALRNSNLPLPGHVYWMVFANPGKLVKSGEHVSVKIGKFHANRLVVK